MGETADIVRGRAARGARSPAPLPAVSPLLWNWFGWYAERFLKKSFHAVRIMRGGGWPLEGDRPAVVYLNHPGWWDPMVCIFLARRFAPGRRHVAPIDAGMLERYGIFKRLGFFGVEKDSARGAAAFLRTGGAAATTPGAVLWVTAEGEFTDVRKRPVTLAAGLGRLWERCPHVAVVPLAVEYPFWTERTPEVLLRFGPVVSAADGEDRQGLLERALENAMDALADAATAKDPSAFETVLGGSVGTSRAYDAWRWARAKLRGEHFRRGHMDGGAG